MRFPILKYTNRLRLKNVSTVVYACVILHNILNAIGIPLPDDVPLESPEAEADYN